MNNRNVLMNDHSINFRKNGVLQNDHHPTTLLYNNLDSAPTANTAGPCDKNPFPVGWESGGGG